MNITLRRHYGFELTIEAENVKITEDIEERIYPKDENGKTIINLNPTRDIKSEYIDMFISVLDDMFYYRVAEYNSNDIIERMFKKLPDEVAIELLDKLNKDYSTT